LKNIAITGIHWGAYAKLDKGRIPVVWKDLLDLLAAGKVKPVVYTETFPLENLPAGLDALEKRKTWGKAIVHIREEKSIQAKL